MAETYTEQLDSEFVAFGKQVYDSFISSDLPLDLKELIVTRLNT